MTHVRRRAEQRGGRGATALDALVCAGSGAGNINDVGATASASGFQCHRQLLCVPVARLVGTCSQRYVRWDFSKLFPCEMKIDIIMCFLFEQ